MRRVIRKIQKKRGLLIIPDKCQRMVGQVIRYESLTMSNLSIMLQYRVPIIAPMARTETIKLLKTTGIRMIRILCTIMPFPKTTCRITRRLEIIRYRPLVKIDPLSSLRDGRDTATNMITSGKKFRTRRLRDRTDIKVLKDHTLIGDPVNIRSPYKTIPCKT